VERSPETKEIRNVAAPRPYDPPAVVYEATLEVRAGSPVGLPDPLNLMGGDK
jgi:hypothetical protein